MRKLVLTICAISACVLASAFDIREHAVIAYIAEQHLSPEARAVVSEMLEGEHLCEYSSHPDFFRKEWKRDDGKEYQHSFWVDENYYANGKGADMDIKDAAARIKDWKRLSQEDRVKYMSLIIHLVGDIHCPAHIHYADNRDQRVKYVNYRLKRKDTPKHENFHAFWDAYALNQRYHGGFIELAYIFDTWSDERIAEAQKGSIDSWAHDSAMSCKDIYYIEDEADVYRPYVIRQGDLIKEQVTKAGYRLAALLNSILR